MGLREPTGIMRPLETSREGGLRHPQGKGSRGTELGPLKRPHLAELRSLATANPQCRGSPWPQSPVQEEGAPRISHQCEGRGPGLGALIFSLPSLVSAVPPVCQP